MTPIAELAEGVSRLASGRVLVVGDVMLDRAVHGRVLRISPEAPIPILEAVREIAVPGGAANVAANLAALGAQVALVGVVGEDAPGRTLAELLAPLVAGRFALIAEPGRPTTEKTRYVAAGQQLLRVDNESRDPLAGSVAAEVAEVARRALGEVSTLVLSDYAKGVLRGGLARELIGAARAQGKPVLVDPKGNDWERYRGASLLTPNRAELAAAVGTPSLEGEAVEGAARAVRQRFALDAVLVTLAADGMLLVEAERTTPIAGIPREVFDVVGAGDTVLAVVAAALAAGLALPQAAQLANIAGSIAVTREGTATVGAADLRLALAQEQGGGHLEKIVDRETLMVMVERERRAGRRIGFTNGCFDLLHPGHASLIAQARARCDMLIVGLNSDGSVRRLKGPGRPVNHAAARAAVLAALAGVDAVVVFDEDTPIDLIRAIRPDVLVKGADYSLDQVVGASDVLGWGGEVHLATLTPEISTTRVIERLSGLAGR